MIWKFLSRFYIVVLPILLICSCVKDKPNSSTNGYSYFPGDKVYFINEGNYGSGNASIGVCYYEEDNLFNNIYETVNNEILGDVFQSMIRVEDKLLLSINNSDLIRMINPITFQQEGILNINSPRYFYSASPNKIYISSLYSNEVTVYNSISNNIEKVINLPTHSVESMIEINNKIFMSSWDENATSIYVVNPLSDEVEKKIELGVYAPQNILEDKNGNIWIKYGNYKFNRPFGFIVYDPNEDKIIKKMELLAGNNELIKPIFNSSKDTLYWIHVDYTGSLDAQSGIFRMSITDSVFPQTPFFKAERFQYYYALGIDPWNGDIWIGDPKSFTEASDVYRVNTDGEILQKWKTGLGIGSFYFDSY